MSDRIPRSPATLALVCLGTFACSNVPPATRPASLALHVEVEYEIPAEQDDPIELPMSGRYLTVLELATDPPDLAETYRENRRFLHPPDGPATVLVRCRYRIYAAPGSGFSPTAELFPGAAAIRVLAPDR